MIRITKKKNSISVTVVTTIITGASPRRRRRAVARRPYADHATTSGSAFATSPGQRGSNSVDRLKVVLLPALWGRLWRRRNFHPKEKPLQNNAPRRGFGG